MAHQRWLLVCLALAAPNVARANIGPRWQGDYAAEPLSALKSIVIQREKLAIDLRPFRRGEPAEVTATYHLLNEGSGRQLDLVFVAGGDSVSSFTLKLGGRPLASELLQAEEAARRLESAPPSWKPPKLLIGVDEDRTDPTYVAYRRSISLLAFALTLPPGPSELTARYRVRASGVEESRSPMATWVLPYVLAPAREWGGFGGLDVAVTLPEGWQHRCNPDLAREGDTLRGSFTGLPADCLVVAARAPVPPEFSRRLWVAAVCFVLAVICGGWLCWLSGRLLRFSRRGSVKLAVLALTGVPWAAVILIGARVAMDHVRGALGGQESPYYHERLFLPGCGSLVLAGLAVLFGGGLALSALGSESGKEGGKQRVACNPRVRVGE